MIDLFELYEKMGIKYLTIPDIFERNYLKLKDRIGMLTPSTYLKEVCTYLGVDESQALKIASESRIKMKEKWSSKPRNDDISRSECYSEDDFYTASFAVRNRTMTWHFIAKIAPGRKILDYGCGTGEMINWLLKKYPDFEYSVADLGNAKHMDFVRWRFRDKPVKIINLDPDNNKLSLKENYDLITCFEVLFWLSQPDKIVQHWIDHLNPGGRLLFDFYVHPDLINNKGPYLEESINKRNITIDLLSEQMTALKPLKKQNRDNEKIIGWDGIGIYEKSKAT